MPNVTLTLSNEAEARLQEAVDYYNQNTSGTLTPKAWIILVLRQAIIATNVAEFKKTQLLDMQSIEQTLETELSIS